MRKLFLTLFLSIFALTAYSAPTKSTAAVDEWAEVAQNAVREGATTDISGNYGSVVSIVVASSTETAHTGTKVEVQISSNTTGDEDWSTFTSAIACVGTANTQVLGGSEAIGQTVLEVASTTGYLADETRWIFLEDNVVASSELLLLVSHVADTSVTIQDGLTNAHDTSDALFNIVDTFNIVLPMSAVRVRIIYDNTYDADGSTVHTYSRISKTTGL